MCTTYTGLPATGRLEGESLSWSPFWTIGECASQRSALLIFSKKLPGYFTSALAFQWRLGLCTFKCSHFFFLFFWEGHADRNSGSLVCGRQHGTFRIPSEVPPIRANTEFRSLAVGWSSWRETDVEASAPQWRTLLHKHNDLSSVLWTQAWGCALVSSV